MNFILKSTNRQIQRLFNVKKEKKIQTLRLSSNTLTDKNYREGDVKMNLRLNKKKENKNYIVLIVKHWGL